MEKPDLSLYPESPGVYLYKDESGRILYVGKARRLRRRLASYFRDTVSPKTRALLAHATSIEVLITGTEKEALLLEAGLIKKHRPRYNIVLRDDKEYLLFRIGMEHPYPRLEILRRARTGIRKGSGSDSQVGKQPDSPKNGSPKSSSPKNGREKRKDKARIFGPFSEIGAARETWRLIHKHFPLRRCRDRAFANRTRPCLYHHMGQCLGPCVLPVPQEEYRAVLDKAALLLSGKSRLLLQDMKAEMSRASDALEFERAARLRDQIRAVERTVERQSVVLAAGTDLDVVGVVHIASSASDSDTDVTSEDAEGENPGGLALGVLFVRDGLLLDGRSFFWPGLDVEDGPELVVSFLEQFYLERRELGEVIPPRIIAPYLSRLTDDAPDTRDSGKPVDMTNCGCRGRPSPTPGVGGGNVSQFPLPGESEGVADPGGWAEPPQKALESLLGEYRGGQVRIRPPRGADEDNLSLMAASTAREAVRTAVKPDMAQLLTARLHHGAPVRRIEVVDISHTGGRQTRAGMVVFQDGKPEPSAFRAYSLDEQMAEAGMEAGDDTAALALWAARRSRAGAPWPDLLLVDGGRGQLAAVLRAFTEAGIAGEFALASIAKARTEEGRADRRAGNVGDRIFLPGRSNPLPLPPGGQELLFLQRIRDAAHDFVLGRHRRARAKAVMDAELTRIPGIGPSLARVLFERFGSLEAMRRAGESALAEVPGIGKKRAETLHRRLAILLGKGD